MMAAQRAFELLDQVLQLAPDARASYLDEACGTDGELRHKVEKLLELESDAENFLPRPATPPTMELPPLAAVLPPAQAPPALVTGTRIGPYRIEELIGRGGMGSVYRALRQDDFVKPVAIKLLARHLVRETMVRGFHTERQILARLEHPGIARLLDGGTTAEGRPYLVMEYVDGIPIDRYCDVHQLAADARLELFSGVLEALAFAHRNLVVHRDLKPSNILVTAAGVPKLLDFGIAKLLDPEASGTVTHLTQRPMTPRYASPEQVRGEPISTASDIYSLGVTLYEILTGVLPCELSTCGYAEIPRRICDDEPMRPSTAARRESAGGEGRKRRRPLSRDVDAIVLKALRKQPEHRYATVDEMAGDIRCHLEGLPVAARKGTWLYRAGRYARRYRWGLVTIAALVLTTAMFIAVEWRRLEGERARARRFAAALEEMVTVADPDAGALSAEALLDRARAQLADLEREPELQVELLDSLGRIHLKLGHFAEARELFAESLVIWRRQHRGDHPRLALRINNLASIESKLGNQGAAEELFREVLAIRKRLGEDGTEDFAVNLNNLATVLLGRGAYDEAEIFYRRALEIRERTLGADDPRVSNSLRSLGALFRTRGEPAMAEPLLRRALDIRLRAYGDEHTAVASVLDLLGGVRFDQGDSVEAEALITRALTIRRQRLGYAHPKTAWSERNLAALLVAEGELETARVLLERAGAHLRRAELVRNTASGSWRVADVESLLGATLAAEGRRAEAEACLVEGYRVVREVRGDDASYTREARRRLEELYEIWERPHVGQAAPADSS